MHFELIFICHVIHDPPSRYVTINDSHHHIRIPWPSLGLTITLGDVTKMPLCCCCCCCDGCDLVVKDKTSSVFPWSVFADCN